MYLNISAGGLMEIRVGVTLVDDESRHLGTLTGEVDLDTDPDFQARGGESYESGQDPEVDVIFEDIAKQEGCSVEELLHDVSKAVPKIKLDDGRIIFGFECYWQPITPEEETIFHMLPKPQYDE